jgi:hypothetical protein
MDSSQKRRLLQSGAGLRNAAGGRRPGSPRSRSRARSELRPGGAWPLAPRKAGGDVRSRARRTRDSRHGKGSWPAPARCPKPTGPGPDPGKPRGHSRRSSKILLTCSTVVPSTSGSSGRPRRREPDNPRTKWPPAARQGRRCGARPRRSASGASHPRPSLGRPDSPSTRRRKPTSFLARCPFLLLRIILS